MFAKGLTYDFSDAVILVPLIININAHNMISRI